MASLIINIFSAAFCLLLLYIIITKRRKRPQKIYAIQEEQRALMRSHIYFYSQLQDAQQREFEDRMQKFLARTKITGVNTEVEPLDKLLIAAGAIIPVFAFADWEYTNLFEILLYPDSFDRQFNQQGDERTTLGLVGDGPYQGVMILSKGALRHGFMNIYSSGNTAIHEFVHLIDKLDGAMDGVPELLMNRADVPLWQNMVHEKIQQILHNVSDINPYGATNRAEFLAVASEYFFERPDLMQAIHRELYELMSRIFRQQPMKNIVEETQFLYHPDQYDTNQTGTE
jgi:Mlc titration factor MtfA (ptsG expression regulator)